jgi:hypothetical protein
VSFFLICPRVRTAARTACQSFFSFNLVPSMRPPLEECEAAEALRAAGAEPFVLRCAGGGLRESGSLERVAAIDPDLIVLIVTFGTLEDDLRWS